jgi:hypothetical protein
MFEPAPQEGARAQDSATQGTTDATGGEAEGSQTAPPEGQPSWPEGFEHAFPEIAAKFKDPYALARSYAELERWFHAVRAQHQSETVQEEAGADQASAASPETPDDFLTRLVEQPQQTLQALVDQRVRALLEDFRTEQQALQVAQSAAQAAWQRLVAKYPDAPQVEAAMTRYLHTAIGMLQDGHSLDDAVERVYHLAKGNPDAARAAAAAERQRVLQQVRSTTVEAGGGGVPRGTPSPEQRVIADILAAQAGSPPLTS